MVYVGADHRGFILKGEMIDYLKKQGYQVKDLGTNSEEPVDYPEIAKKVGAEVAGDPNNRGVLLCGSGAGVCIAANKINGIRAAQAWDPEVARLARNDDNINVLCLGADRISSDDAKPIVQKFLSTSFGGAERFNRRLKQIQELEGDK
ncbi:MAG: Ribose 5-phosphate isomerase B [Parcubacteria group bacterium GW2011_GWA2_51_12]|nr:MAG: Ribose 5-phosphate isomerase B [Parcubacteria group bacterium GW2011_GWA2_51_12]